MIKAIVACDKKWGIAKDGKIPWYNKEDFALFKKLTRGDGYNVIFMGRKTKDSLPLFPLPGRKNVVLTRNLNIGYDEISTWNELKGYEYDADDIFIIGGKSIYEYAFENKIPEEIYVSRIQGDYECDLVLDTYHLQENYKIREKIKQETFVLEIWTKKR